MKKTIKARIIVSHSGGCYRLSVKKKDVTKLKLSHLQKLKVCITNKKKTKFDSKITAASDRTHWRINVPVLKAQQAMLVSRSDIKIVLAI